MIERRACYWLARIGLRLQKSRSRNGRDPSYQRYRIVEDGIAIAGGAPWDYSMTLEDVEAFVATDGEVADAE